MFSKFVILFLFIAGLSYIISKSYPTVQDKNEVHGFTSIVSAQAESRNRNQFKDTEIVKFLLPYDRNQ